MIVPSSIMKSAPRSVLWIRNFSSVFANLAQHFQKKEIGMKCSLHPALDLANLKEKKKKKQRKEKKERKKKPGLICIFYHVDIFILYPHIKFAEIS